MKLRYLLLFSILLFTTLDIAAQPGTSTKIRDALATQNCVEDGVKICKYDYISDGLSDRAHGIGPEVTTETIDFFKRRLARK